MIPHEVERLVRRQPLVHSRCLAGIQSRVQVSEKKEVEKRKGVNNYNDVGNNNRPTDYFTTLKLQNQSNDDFELHIIRRSPDTEALKF